MSEAESEIERIAALLREIGYRAQVDGISIRTAMSGWNVLVFVSSDRWVQMYLGISVHDDDGFGIEQANKFNGENRFVKCYIKSDTVRFEQDFYFDVSSVDAKRALEQILETWEISIDAAEKALRSANRQNHEKFAPPPAPAN